MGRKPLSKSELELRGSWRAKGKSAPLALKVGAPSKPGWLSAEAGKMWDRVVPELARAGAICDLDWACLIMLCESWADYRLAEAAVKKVGILVKGTRGTVKRNPAIVARDAFLKIFFALAKEYGLTPVGRRRLPATPAPDGSKSKFFKGRA